MIKILGKDFEVKHVSGNEFNGSDRTQIGQVDSAIQQILILEGMPEQTKNETLLHEIIHAIDDAFSLKLDERVVVSLSSALYCVLKENGIEVKFKL